MYKGFIFKEVILCFIENDYIFVILFLKFCFLFILQVGSH